MITENEIEKLVELAESKGLTSGNFDGVIHEVAGQVATKANNGGLFSQFEFLIAQGGSLVTVCQLAKLILASSAKTSKGK